MITKNLKNILAAGLQSASQDHGNLRVTDVFGVSWYTVNNWTFPSSRTAEVTTVADYAGISVGSGDTVATEDNINLESTLTSGVSLQLSATELGCDAPGNPFVLYKVTVTNTGSDAITVREIGYKQSVKCRKYPGSVGAYPTNRVCLIDRTVLDTPITVQGGDAGVIYYKLRTNVLPTRTVSGVEIVSWEWGEDAKVAAMITAARNGTINLQTDGGWRVGDVRLVNIGAFTGGGSVSHAAQTVGLVISSFAEYEGCGNVMQFDFLDALEAGNRLRGEATTSGGYGATEMYSVTLPRLVAALPNWLQTLLLPFSVKASAGGGSETIETIPNNKLALRSEIEILGTIINSKAGEGTWVTLYQYGDIPYKTKTRGTASSLNGDWWLRSPYSASTFCDMPKNSVISGYVNPTVPYGVAPFGCI